MSLDKKHTNDFIVIIIHMLNRNVNEIKWYTVNFDAWLVIQISDYLERNGLEWKEEIIGLI